MLKFYRKFRRQRVNNHKETIEFLIKTDFLIVISFRQRIRFEKHKTFKLLTHLSTFLPHPKGEIQCRDWLGNSPVYSEGQSFKSCSFGVLCWCSRDLCHSIQANVRTLPKATTQPLPSTSLTINYSVITLPLDVIHKIWLLKSTYINK